jgi:hypothetical protein
MYDGRTPQLRGKVPRGEPASKRLKVPGEFGQVPEGQMQGRNKGQREPQEPRELIDMAWLEKTYPPINTEEFPSRDKQIFQNPKVWFTDPKNGLAVSSFAHYKHPVYSVTMILKLSDGEKVEALGEAKNKVGYICYLFCTVLTCL